MLKIDSAIKSQSLNENMNHKNGQYLGRIKVECWQEFTLNWTRNFVIIESLTITETINTILVNEIIFFSSRKKRNRRDLSLDKLVGSNN